MISEGDAIKIAVAYAHQVGMREFRLEKCDLFDDLDGPVWMVIFEIPLPEFEEIVGLDDYTIIRVDALTGNVLSVPRL